MLNLVSQKHTPIPIGWWLSDPAVNRVAFGVILHLKKKTWIVARTLRGSPAEKCGIAAGEQFIAVDRYELGPGKGDISELYYLMLLSRSVSHEVTFRNASGEFKREVARAPLRALLEYDFANGGGLDGYCVGCRTGRPVITGAIHHCSGCSIPCCTVG